MLTLKAQVAISVHQESESADAQGPGGYKRPSRKCKVLTLKAQVAISVHQENEKDVTLMAQVAISVHQESENYIRSRPKWL